MSCNTGKCMRPGRVTSNGYLNFLRQYRKKHCGMTAVETVTKGARAWNRLTNCEKEKFRKMGCGAKKKRSRSRSRSGCRRKPARRSCSRPKRRPSCGRKVRRRPKCRSKAKRCMRPGPITKNGYLNFLRKFRKSCCGLSPQETIRRGARKWCALTSEEKEKFRRAGNRRRRRRKC